jgi:tetratricopeptide (TPR) repeat protein
VGRTPLNPADDILRPRTHTVARVPKPRFATVAVILLLAPLALAEPPASQPAPAREALPSEAIAKRVEQLTGEAIRALDRSDLPVAARKLLDALELQPANPVTLYNLACVNARWGRPDDALLCLEAAAAAGFNDFALLGRDPDLDSIRQTDRFKAFFAARDEWQRRAAGRIVGVLKRKFGDAYLYGIDAEQKLIFATGVNQETLDDLKSALRRQAASQARDLFPHKPDAFISVVIPAPGDFRKFVRQRNVGGFYNDANKLLIAQRVGDYMAHEFTHALHAGDRAPLGQDHAIWVAEGLGVLYEGAVFAGDQMVPLDNDRFPVARDAARRKTLVPLAHLVKMPPEEFVRRGRITYAEAGTLMLFLRDRNRLRPFYDAYKETFATDPTGRAALEKVTGGSLDELEKAYSEWLVTRPSMRRQR